MQVKWPPVHHIIVNLISHFIENIDSFVHHICTSQEPEERQGKLLHTVFSSFPLSGRRRHYCSCMGVVTDTKLLKLGPNTRYCPKLYTRYTLFTATNSFISFLEVLIPKCLQLLILSTSDRRKFHSVCSPTASAWGLTITVRISFQDLTAVRVLLTKTIRGLQSAGQWAQVEDIMECYSCWRALIGLLLFLLSQRDLLLGCGTSLALSSSPEQPPSIIPMFWEKCHLGLTGLLVQPDGSEGTASCYK